MSTKDVDGYLAGLPEHARAALAQLRASIRAAAPTATEVISMGAPTYKHHGVLVSFAAAKSHCSFYVMSASVMEAHRAELVSYDTAKTAIRFPAAEPLPDDLVRKLVQARIQENEAAGAR